MVIAAILELAIEVSENDLAAEDKRNEIRSPFYTFTEYTR